MNRKSFLKLFFNLRKFIIKGISKQKLKKNSKRQITKYFDKFIENKIINFLKQNFKIKAEIISEELNKNIIINEKLNTEKYYIVIDPVDGSDNYVFNINFVCLAIAVFDENLTPVFSFVGNYFSGYYIIADKKSINFNPVKKSNKRDEEIIFFTFSGIGEQKLKNSLKLISKIKCIRTLGATVGEMLLVARGDIDAFVDIRNKLTLENFVPFCLIAKHTQAILTDEKGNKIKIKNLSLSKGYNIIFSKDKKMHCKILKMVNY